MKTLNRLSALSLVALTLSGCGDDDASGVAKTLAAASNASFEITTTHALELIDVGGGTINTSAISNGMGTLGDSSSQPKRLVMTFPISSLSGKQMKSAKLRIVYDSKSSTSIISNLGAIRAYTISPHATIVSADWSLSENLMLNLITSTGALPSAQYQVVEVDVQSALQSAINVHDSYLTVKIRHDSDLAGGTNTFNFFVHYSSVPLNAYIPRLVGEF